MRLTDLICAIFIFFATLSNAAKIYPLLEQPNIKSVPIVIGETLTYNAKIKIGIFPIPAGEQLLEVVEETELLEHPVYHLRSVAETNGFFSKIYNFKERRESYVTKDKFYPLLYTKKIHDRNYRGNYRISFDLEDGKATSIRNRKQKVLDVFPGIQDELSMLYFVRTKKLDIGKKYQFPVLISSKIYKVVIEVLRRELRKTVIGKVNTLVLRTSNGYKLWLTDDNSRIPIRIEAKTKIGTLTAELKKIEY